MEIELSRDLKAVYVLNLERRADRLDSFQTRAAAAGLTGRLAPVRIEAVDGREFPVFRDGCRPAESATTMGHRYLWGLALARRGAVLILEDDVTFCRRFSEHLEETLVVPDDCDMLQLGMSWLKLEPGEGPVRRPRSGWGTFAYVLFPSGAEKLLRREGAAPFSIADHCTAPGRQGWQMAITYPMWVTVTNEDSDIAPDRAHALRRMGRHFEDDFETEPALPTAT